MKASKNLWFWLSLGLAVVGLGALIFVKPAFGQQHQPGIVLLPLDLSRIMQGLVLVSWIVKLWQNQRIHDEAFALSYQSQFLPRFFEAASLTLAWIVLSSISSLVSLLLAALTASRYLALVELVSRQPALRQSSQRIKDWTGFLFGWSLAMLMFNFLLYFLSRDFTLIAPGMLSAGVYSLFVGYGLYQFIRLGNYRIVLALIVYLMFALVQLWPPQVHWAVTLWIFGLVILMVVFIYRYHYRLNQANTSK